MELGQRFQSYHPRGSDNSREHICLPGLVTCTEIHPLQKPHIWCLRVFLLVHSAKLPLLNVCKWNLFADTWTSFQQVEKILHPMRGRWPIIQCVCDSHQAGFIRAFSSHNLVQDWLANGTADLCLYPVAGLLGCSGLVWFLPSAPGQWLCLPTYHTGFVTTCKWSELRLILPEWSIIEAENYSHSKELVWEYYMVKNTRNCLVLHLPPRYSLQPLKWYDSRWGGLRSNCRVQNCITGFGNQV